MIKLSKSDRIDKEQEAKDREVLSNPKKSQHFAVGTFVNVYGKGRGEILARHTCNCPNRETFLHVEWEDGSIGSIRPIALNR